MVDLSTVTTADWIAFYGAALSSVIAIVAVVRYVAHNLRLRKERAKFQTDLYFLRKIDRSTKQVHPIVVVLLANLGTQRISLKSLDYEGIAENGIKMTGSMGGTSNPKSCMVFAIACCHWSSKVGRPPTFQWSKSEC